MNRKTLVGHMAEAYNNPTLAAIYSWVILTPSYWALVRPHKIYPSVIQYNDMLKKTGQKYKELSEFSAYTQLLYIIKYAFTRENLIKLFTLLILENTVSTK